MVMKYVDLEKLEALICIIRCINLVFIISVLN